MATYSYCVVDQCEESRYKFGSSWDRDSPEYLAEDAADNFHHLHDGWECDWPLTFRVFDTDGQKIGDFEIDRDMSPVFSATSI